MEESVREVHLITIYICWDIDCRNSWICLPTFNWFWIISLLEHAMTVLGLTATCSCHTVHFVYVNVYMYICNILVMHVQWGSWTCTVIHGVCLYITLWNPCIQPNWTMRPMHVYMCVSINYHVNHKELRIRKRSSNCCPTFARTWRQFKWTVLTCSWEKCFPN